jgi:hypothetical protein
VLVTVANDVRAARFTGNPNWLLDMTPETAKLGDEALPVGRPFADALPGGPKFTLLSVDATKAVVEVELDNKPATGQAGKGACEDGTAYQTSPAVNCVASATPAAPAPDGGLPPPPDAMSMSEPHPPTNPDAGMSKPPAPDAGATVEPPPDDPGATPTAHPTSSGCSYARAAASDASLVGLLLLLAGAARRCCRRHSSRLRG